MCSIMGTFWSTQLKTTPTTHSLRFPLCSISMYFLYKYVLLCLQKITKAVQGISTVLKKNRPVKSLQNSSKINKVKGGLISESFSHVLRYQKLCQITILCFFPLGGQCSGQGFGIFFGEWKHFLRSSNFQQDKILSQMHHCALQRCTYLN